MGMTIKGQLPECKWEDKAGWLAQILRQLAASIVRLTGYQTALHPPNVLAAVFWYMLCF